MSNENRVQYRCPLTGLRRSLLFPSKPEADAFRLNIKADIVALAGGRMTLPEFRLKWEARTPTTVTTIDTALALWREHLRTSKSKKTGELRTASHVRDVTQSVARIAKACDCRYVSDLTPDALTEHFDKLDGQNRNLNASALDAFMDYLVRNRRQILRENPLVVNGRFVFDTVTTKAKNPSRALSPLQVENICAVAGDHELAIRVRYTTGLRRSELAQLRWENLDTRNGVLRLDGSQTKNRQAAIVPFDPSLNKPLAEASLGKDPGALMFPAFTDAANSRRRWRKIIDKAGIPWLAPLADDPDNREGRADEKSLRVSFNNGLMEALGVGDDNALHKLMMRHRVDLAHSVYAKPSTLLDGKREALDRFLQWHAQGLQHTRLSLTA